MEQECKLCKQSKPLRRSHIIPEFMYQNVYDTEPKRYYVLTINEEKKTSNSKVEQKGIRENLLCEDCELLLSKYEAYAAEALYGKNKRNKANIFNASETPDKRLFLYEVKGFSYKDFKIFLMSILWRLLISKYYDTPEIEVDILEKLRLSILNQDPLDEDEFGCLVQIIKYQKDNIVKGFIINPYVTSNENTKVLNILIDGMMYSFYLPTKEMPKFNSIHFLRKDGFMNIPGRIIFDDENLFGMLKQGYDLLGNKLK